MDYKSIQTAVDGLSASIDSKFASFDAQIAEMKNAMTAQPAQKQADDVEMKAYQQFCATGQKAASLTTTPGNAQEVAIPRYTQIYDQMRADNQILSVINTISVNGYTGASIPVDVAEPAVNVVGEGAKVNETNPTIDIKNITLAKYMAKVGISLEMAQASAVEDFTAYIQRQVADAMGRKLADDVTAGILADSDFATINSATSGKLATEDLFDAMGAVVDKANNNGKWIMNSKTYYALAKQVGKDAGWFTMPYTEGVRPSMFGHEVVFDSAMPDVAGTKVAVAYGDFNHAVTAVQASGMTSILDTVTGLDYGLNYIRCYQLFNSALVRPESIVGIKIKQ